MMTRAWLCAAVAAVRAAGSAPSSHGGGGRALFIAGLEGTGHNFWHDTFGPAAEKGWVRRMSHDLMKVEWKSSEEMMEPWGEMELGAQPGLPLVLNTLAPAQLQSYPACNNISRAQHAWPGLDEFAKTASAWGDRVDVLLMLRRADDVMLSDMRRWKHPAWLEVMAAKELKRQLLTLPPNSKIVCLDFEDLSVVSMMLAAFLGNAGFAHEAPETFDASMLHHCESDNCRSKELAEAMDDLRAFCPDQPELATSKDSAANSVDVRAEEGPSPVRAADIPDAALNVRTKAISGSVAATSDALKEEEALKTWNAYLANMREFKDHNDQAKMQSHDVSQLQGGRQLRKQRRQSMTQQHFQRQRQRHQQHHRIKRILQDAFVKEGHSSPMEARLSMQVQRGINALDFVFGPDWSEQANGNAE